MVERVPVFQPGTGRGGCCRESAQRGPAGCFCTAACWHALPGALGLAQAPAFCPALQAVWGTGTTVQEQVQRNRAACLVRVRMSTWYKHPLASCHTCHLRMPGPRARQRGRRARLERGVFGRGHQQPRVCRPGHLVDRPHMAAQRGHKCAAHAVPQLQRLVEGRAHHPAAVRRELHLRARRRRVLARGARGSAPVAAAAVCQTCMCRRLACNAWPARRAA